MKRTALLFVTVIYCLAGFAGMVLLSGCEEATNTRGLTIDPSFVDLSIVSTNYIPGNSNITYYSQTFTVKEESLGDLSLPLEWRVSNPGLGYIASSGGRSASYVRTTGRGDNAIIVEDQYGAEGVATVRQ